MSDLEELTEVILIKPGAAPGADRPDSFVDPVETDRGDSFVDAVEADGGDSFVGAFETFSQAIRRARGAGSDHPGGLTFSQYALLRTPRRRACLGPGRPGGGDAVDGDADPRCARTPGDRLSHALGARPPRCHGDV